MKLDAFISTLRSILLKRGNIEVYITTKSVSNLYNALEKDLHISIITYRPKN